MRIENKKKSKILRPKTGTRSAEPTSMTPAPVLSAAKGGFSFRESTGLRLLGAKSKPKSLHGSIKLCTRMTSLIRIGAKSPNCWMSHVRVSRPERQSSAGNAGSTTLTRAWTSLSSLRRRTCCFWGQPWRLASVGGMKSRRTWISRRVKPSSGTRFTWRTAWGACSWVWEIWK